MKIYFLVLLLLITSKYTISFAQVIDHTGFESYADETEYTLSSWQSDGFTVPWVNGFNQSRAHVDDAFAKFGTKSLRIKYPANQFGPANSGAQAPLNVTPANELYMSYWVRFSDNFDWGGTSEGGKLPGLGGGGRCSGCTVCTGSNGFTARLMWRAGGKAVLYLYHMEADKANGPCGDNDVLQVSSGVDFYFQKGQWYNVVQRVKVNTGTNHDGEVQLWINGQQALLRTGIQFVSNGDKVDNLYFSTFHGGSTSAWSPSVDCYTWFDDMKIASTLADVLPATNQLPTVSITAPVTNTKKCVGESLSITTNAADSDGSISKVEFYNGTTLLGTVTSSPFNYTMNSLSLGTYSLTAKAYDNLDATTTSTIITVTVNPLPTASITASGTTTFCQGGNVSLTTSGGTSYQWNNAAGPISGATNASYSAITTGSYSVKVTNANTCSATSTATAVTVNPSPTASITASGTTTFCQGGNVSLTTSGGTSYQWNNAAGQISGATNASYSAITTGSYSVKVTNANTCSAMSTATAVTVNPLPTASITASGTTTFCQGGNVSLTTSGGTSYQWNNAAGPIAGATNASYSAITTGSYSVKVTNANTCSATSTATAVTVSSPLTWYQDLDGDGKGDAAVTQTACTQPAGYVSISGDACPTDANKLNPGLCGCGTQEGTCQTTGVVDLKSTDAIKVMPNPSSDEFNLILAESAVVYIYSVEGKLIETFPNMTEVKFGSNYAKGIYVIQIMNGSTTQIVRVIKQ